ncbi:membrane protein [Caballeronia pedi]|uniref:Membrane protein n=1 Tax=Caballeronia pedi TaxID=1777141 RepID=A0A158DRQ8_9BURK|nr:PepSY-associated TM helix domain-containing protein [Caballeronia pedi]SAK97268.1 membrane protein [Caballeronia pedi]
MRIWHRLHTWSSLICTAFLLLLCLTGLPLIFHDEIDALIDAAPVRSVVAKAGEALPVDLDHIVADVAARYPGERVQFVIWSDDGPDLLKVNLAPPAGVKRGNRLVAVDEHSGAVLGAAWSQRDWRRGNFMTFLLALHTDLLMGTAGSLVFCAVGLLFVIALVSGVVIYGRFMRKLEFGTVRHERGRRIRWLDLHNLLGIATLCWALVVGATGILNTLDTMLFGYWQKTELAELIKPYRDLPPVEHPASVARATEVARKAVPGRTPSFVAYPGSFFSSRYHYTVFMRGETPLTSRVLAPVLVDARTLQVSAVGELPWYLVALEASRPLHFGDYGGLPFKALWAMLDLMTIVVLAGGLYLWFARRRAERRRGRQLSSASNRDRGVDIEGRS